MKYIICLGAVYLAACSAWQWLVEPQYPAGRCHYTENECHPTGCCPATTRCTPNGCVADPESQNVWIKLGPDASAN